MDNAATSIPVVIPAYNPGATLLDLVADLTRGGVRHIIVVNDGSAPASDFVFSALANFENTVVVRHAINLGKGAALKSAINRALCLFPDCPGIVTGDADGQHTPQDIFKIARRLAHNPRALILGARQFDDSVPLRSKFGNLTARVLLRLLAGQRVSDTQTGLRGIPRALLPHLLRIPASGYEFELDMLLACKHQAYPILEEPIATVYLDGNRSSHFDPLLDSMRVFAVLLRFGLVSFLTAILDNSVFFLVFHFTGKTVFAQLAGRLLALLFNYAGNRNAVFHSQLNHARVLPKYLALVAVNGVLSYQLIGLFSRKLELSVYAAKITAESLLFPLNFVIQRDFVFTRKQPALDDPQADSIPVRSKQHNA